MEWRLIIFNSRCLLLVARSLVDDPWLMEWVLLIRDSLIIVTVPENNKQKDVHRTLFRKWKGRYVYFAKLIRTCIVIQSLVHGIQFHHHDKLFVNLLALLLQHYKPQHLIEIHLNLRIDKQHLEKVFLLN